MKKLLVITLVLVLTLVASSCGNNLAKQAEKRAIDAIMSCDYETALQYAKIAVAEGSKDEKIIRLCPLLENYIAAEKALETNDVEAAQKALSEINDFPESGMTYYIEKLQNKLNDMLEEENKYEEALKDIESSIQLEVYHYAAECAEELLEEDDLTPEQRKKAEELLKKANEGKNKTSGGSSTTGDLPERGSPKAILSEAEAVSLAAEQLVLPNGGEFDVTLQGDYYHIFFTFPSAPGETNELSCDVNVYTGEIINIAG